MQIERVLGSKTRLKILRILYQVGGLNVSEIARRIGANHKVTLRHLEILENEGILTHKTFGRIKIYRFKEGSPKAVTIQKFFKEWENAEKH
ncbi:MAG: winged helix-turn-helix domain-containing protein [Candidatus Bathyarchaeota archaeon]|nr:winged helix-turn-helix domain-containing protein [Candidatus Bathyarchaeota archaeon]